MLQVAHFDNSNLNGVLFPFFSWNDKPSTDCVTLWLEELQVLSLYCTVFWFHCNVLPSGDQWRPLWSLLPSIGAHAHHCPVHSFSTLVVANGLALFSTSPMATLPACELYNSVYTAYASATISKQIILKKCNMKNRQQDKVQLFINIFFKVSTCYV